MTWLDTCSKSVGLLERAAESQKPESPWKCEMHLIQINTSKTASLLMNRRRQRCKVFKYSRSDAAIVVRMVIY